VLSDILTSDAQDAQDFAPIHEDDYDGGGGGELEEIPPQEVARVLVPMSQLLHFYSPLSWAKVIKLEYETTEKKHSATRPEDHEGDEDLEEEAAAASDQNAFPIRSFVFVYNGDVADLGAALHVSIRFHFSPNLHILIPSLSPSKYHLVQFTLYVFLTTTPSCVYVCI
jgi:hypothetical protein